MVDCYNNYVIRLNPEENFTSEHVNSLVDDAENLEADAVCVRLHGKACGYVQLFQDNGFYVRDWVAEGNYLELVLEIKGDVPPRRTAAIGVSCLVHDGKGNVLVVKERKGNVRSFKFVTGYVKIGEAPHAAALREVKEELGVDVQDCSLYGSFQCSVSQSVDDYWHLYGVCIPSEAKITLQSEELLEFRWVNAHSDANSNLLTALTSAMIGHYVCNAPFPSPLMRGPKNVNVIYSK